jgi:hypothetical protein
MDPRTLRLHHVPDVNAVWYGPVDEGDEPRPGWLFDGVEGDTDADPFLDDFETKTEYDNGIPRRTRVRVERTNEQVQSWAATLISKVAPYRVTEWTTIRDEDSYDNPDSYLPTLVEERHVIQVSYGDDENLFVNADLGNDRWKAKEIVGQLADPDGVIAISLPSLKGPGSTTRTVHIPVRSVRAATHTMAERQVTHEFEAMPHSAIGSCRHCYRPEGAFTHASVTS